MTQSTWHVIRILGEALRPHKIYTHSTTVERSLHDAGISFYIPFARKTIVHHRTKKKIEMRFPLMLGYGFVQDVTNFEALRECKGVLDVIKSAGRPVPIRAEVVSQVRVEEFAINEEHARKEAAKAAREALGTRATVSQAFPVNSRARIKQGHLLAGQEFVVGAATGRGTIKGVIDMLDGFSVEIEAIHLEAAE